jgi:site-specific DNA-methyltransferase (adenine-specific)
MTENRTVPTPYFHNDSITLYHGDCQVLLPQLNFTGLLLTDPPYGIDLSAKDASTRIRYKNVTSDTATFSKIQNDSGTLDLTFLFQYGYPQVIFGANNFPNIVPFDPKKDGWIVWDKRLTEKADKMIGSPFELAVVRGKRLYKFVRLLHGGVVNADGWGVKRVHPTQKPVTLMSRVMKYFPRLDVLDPFAGSGSTLLAAQADSRKAIGIELEERYCEIAATRLRRRP